MNGMNNGYGAPTPQMAQMSLHSQKPPGHGQPPQPGQFMPQAPQPQPGQMRGPPGQFNPMQQPPMSQPGQMPMRPPGVMGGAPPQMTQPGQMAPRPAMGGAPPPGQMRPQMGAPPGQMMPQMSQPGQMAPARAPMGGMMPGAPPPGQHQMGGGGVMTQPPQPGQMGGMPPRPGQPQMGGMPPPMQQQQQQRPGMPPPPMGGQMGGQPQRPGMMPPRPGQMPGQMPMQQRPGGMGGYPAQNQKLHPLDPGIPSALAFMQGDQAMFDEAPFVSDRGAIPPCCTTTIKRGIQDMGSCSPRYCRSALYSLPSTSEMAKQAQVPIALSISAMAEPGPGECPILDSNSDFGGGGPLRCKRCKAYVCPQFRFIDGGRSFQCHLCQAVTEVPQHYFQMTDHMGFRMDRQQRPELCRGSYEFFATKDYCKGDKLPQAPGFIFAIDVSYNSIRTGLVNLVCNIIPTVLDSLPRGEDGRTPVRVGFLTYGHTISFFNLAKELSQPQMMVVGDVDDIFVPLQTGFMVDPDECKENIETLLTQIPQLYTQPTPDACFIPVVQAAAQAFTSANRAGKLFMFHSSLPSANAPGKLANRDDRKLIGSEKEKFLFQPGDKIYETVGKEMVGASASVELFVCPSQFSDVASMAHICHLTGGTLYKYSYFNPDKDAPELQSDLVRAVTRPTAFDAIMKVRTTVGLRPVDFIGSFYMTNTQDIELAGYDADKSVSVELKHDDKLSEQDGAAIQIALLYTNIFGQRKLRIHNLQFNVSSQLADLYRMAETDTLINFFSKLAIRSNRDTSPQKLKEGMIQRFSQILAVYRKHCSDQSSQGQLILPERLKVMPAYMSSLISDDSIFPHHEIPTDERAYLRQKVLQATVENSCVYFYPCVYPMLRSAVDPQDPKPGIRCLFECFKQDQIYVVENGLTMFIWIGAEVNATDISSIWGVNTPMEVGDGPVPIKDTEDNANLRTLIATIKKKRGKQPSQHIIRGGHPDSKILEQKMRRLMKEDQIGNGTTSYVDFLTLVHREIRQLLS